LQQTAGTRLVALGCCVTGRELRCSAQKYDALPPIRTGPNREMIFRFKLSRNPKVSISIACGAADMPFTDACTVAQDAELIGNVISAKSLHPVPRFADVGNRTGRHKAQYVTAQDACARIDQVLKMYESNPRIARSDQPK
jgi:hypothetical protein